MLIDSENILKFKMLSVFEKELDQIFGDFNNQMFSYDECIKYINWLISAWEYCRLDLINISNKKNKIQILEHNNLKVSYPSWFETDKGNGCTVTSRSNDIHLSFNYNDDGKIKIDVRGLDYRNHDGKRVPIYVNCKYLKINGDFVFNENILLWHDNPYSYNFDYSKTEHIDLLLKFETIHDYFPLLKILLTDIIDKDDLCTKYEKVKYYISYEKLLIRINDIEMDVHNAIINL